MYRILIVEDGHAIASNLKSYIEKYGYQVFLAENFEDILADFSKYQPNLVLLDVNLPCYDGFFWCREIRNLSNLPIIFISARTGDLEQIYAMDRGGDDYIVKPFSLDLVIAKIKANLRRARSCRVQPHFGAGLQLTGAAGKKKKGPVAYIQLVTGRLIYFCFLFFIFP